MELNQILIATTVFGILLALVYGHITFAKMKECFGMWQLDG
jgi:hypothetical protein